MGCEPIKNTEKKTLTQAMKRTRKNGIAAISTKEAAHRVGISEPAIFVHFKTKQNLMIRTFEEAWTALLRPEGVKPYDGLAAFDRNKEKAAVARESKRVLSSQIKAFCGGIHENQFE